MPLAAHGVTHPGRRSSNEDAMVVDLGLGLFVVADGMGGHKAGEVASDLAVQTIKKVIDKGGDTDESLLEHAVQVANDQILHTASLRPDYSGMGTTVVAALVRDGQTNYVSVGDSRVYHWRSGRLSQLTRDDSWLANVLDEGTPVDSPEALRHPMRHVLTKVVGVTPDLDPAVARCEFRDGDVLLLCSDGLHGSLNEETIRAALGSVKPIDDIARGLVDLAIARGASDNVTAVVIRRES